MLCDSSRRDLYDKKLLSEKFGIFKNPGILSIILDFLCLPYD